MKRSRSRSPRPSRLVARASFDSRFSTRSAWTGRDSRWTRPRRSSSSRLRSPPSSLSGTTTESAKMAKVEKMRRSVASDGGVERSPSALVGGLVGTPPDENTNDRATPSDEDDAEDDGDGSDPERAADFDPTRGCVVRRRDPTRRDRGVRGVPARARATRPPRVRGDDRGGCGVTLRPAPRRDRRRRRRRERVPNRPSGPDARRAAVDRSRRRARGRRGGRNTRKRRGTRGGESGGQDDVRAAAVAAAYARTRGRARRAGDARSRAAGVRLRRGGARRGSSSSPSSRGTKARGGAAEDAAAVAQREDPVLSKVRRSDERDGSGARESQTRSFARPGEGTAARVSAEIARPPRPSSGLEFQTPAHAWRRGVFCRLETL